MVSELITGMICFILGVAARSMKGGKDGRENNDQKAVSSDLTQAIQAMAEPLYRAELNLGAGRGNRDDASHDRDRANPIRPGGVRGMDGQKYAEKAASTWAQLRPENQKIRQKRPRDPVIYRVSRKGGGDYLILARSGNEARMILMGLLRIPADEAALYQVEEQGLPGRGRPGAHDADL